MFCLILSLLVNFFSPCLLFSLSHLLYLAFLFYLVSVLAFSSLLTLFCLISSCFISSLLFMYWFVSLLLSLFSAQLYSSLFLISSDWSLKKHCHFICSLVFICSFLAFILSSIFSSFSSLFSYSHSLLLSLWIFFLIWSNLSSSGLIYSLLFCLVSFYTVSSLLIMSLTFATFLSFASNPISCSSSCLLFCPI